MDNVSTINKDLSDSKLSDAPNASDVLSERGQANYKNLYPVLSSFIDILRDTYDPEENPGGVINAGIAENSLNYRVVEEYYSSLDIKFTDLTYGDGVGSSQRLKDLYAGFINHRLKPTHKLDSDSIFVGSGVGGVIDALVYNMCDPGDGVLVAEPYYNGFDVDFTVRSSAIPVGVKLDHLDSPFSYKALEAFEKTYLAKKKEGIVCKAVMLCNPHNPLGRCYPRSTIREYIRFCKKYDLWLISDEIYAFSIFDTPDSLAATGEDKAFAPYHSILSFEDEELDGFDKICFLHGMSKDFCANGFRMGCCVLPYDGPLRIAMSASSILGKVSSLTDIAFSKILADKAFLDEFLDGNKQKLKAAYTVFDSWAKAHGVKYMPSHAGHFVVLDLPESTKSDGWADELALQQMLIKKHKIFVSTGAMYHFSEPGFFRWTFTMRPDYAAVALERLATGLGL
ncbi:pyridoxal phosphate-dependent transferase [Protomyces lactucae-debilis]|uniref:Pyridoxal phosphate-dependent transferase n=1 Tax=Protomyces lactucae-debilis TaxID=2754530 RepID=A0A1Y2F6N7_PROLT|nr:pyridoxal phosphate-dependent transferase [Protomyces lactucae-debilis]ORY79541.1 pyridoxal phosphate-dependent transferase [Protomyces lactucae-debilis]